MGDIESAASLPGSSFEIDPNANLVVDTPGNDEWASVNESRKIDLATGPSDNSYDGGSKEDDPCPPVGTGSIPNNKSDLRTFGVYVEPGSGPGDPGRLNVFWTRVQDPSGTTLMDFEFNQSSTDCGNGVNPVRTPGDFLLEYRMEQGGATATIMVRTWEGTAWGPATDLTSVAALGTINTTAIAASAADGLGDLSVRTFGEASIDLDFIFSSDQCVSFGSAFVKSRSSDAFTSQLKDFIAPAPVSISNCGKVVIRKQTDPDGLAGLFDFEHTLQTDPPQPGNTFQLGDDGVQEFTTVLIGNDYTVTETGIPSGFDLSIDCSASVGVMPSTAGATVTFDLDDPADLVDCTYTNRARGTIVIEKITNDGSGSFDFTSPGLGAFTLTTTGPGEGGKDTATFNAPTPGTYAVAETVPAGWNLVSATCDNGTPGAISLSAGETVTCLFVNQRETGAIRIEKTRKHAASGPGSHAHAGVTFQIFAGDSLMPITTATTGADGVACVDGLLLSSFAGDYVVTEVVPAGYAPDGAASKTVAVTTEASCPAGDTVSFGNTPLTTITVAIDSIVPGGTASTIDCTGPVSATAATDPVTGDGSATLSAGLPGTYTCTIVVGP